LLGSFDDLVIKRLKKMILRARIAAATRVRYTT